MLLVGGGTGGHISPLLAIAEALRAADPEVRLLFMGGRRGREATLVPEAGIPLHVLPMASLRDPDSMLALIGALVGVPLAYLAALARIALFRPRVAVASGGAIALPAVLAARTLRVPVYLWAGDALPGRASRMVARFATKIGVTFDQARAHFPPRRATVSGTPIRASLLRWSRDDARRKMDVPHDATLLVITGGSQGSERVNEAVFASLARLLRNAYVLHVTGESHFARAQSRESQLADDLRARYLPRAYLRDEMGAVLAGADLVIGRAGSSSIAEPLAFGVPLVLVPFGAAMEAHQEANARATAEAGAAVVIRESQLDPDRLTAEVAGLLNDPARLTRMSEAARKAGRPDAAKDIARDVLAMGKCA
ncbi:MAG TPA: UDP-N-acetylglucosamine--N-acetylmuramyl-(pentapeptide) pyrophosphoryl-undecaprenol N-acetylglucosamine transferase [Candidatus Limnocylindria bacterium]|nr:UDP-N-acetylglucosamine--N-acetylmuramyl-(pentapeptide) pyrophosphoryl-undecaprenol N-acetylglucosamine transferase [Candidatus Limnocylindria bacterium]